MFFQTFLMKIPLCSGEALNLPLPAWTLGVSMTIRWTAKNTQKSKTQSVDFLGLVLNRFKHFSSEIFPSLSGFPFSWFIVLVFLLFPQTLLPSGSLWFARSNFLLPFVFFFEFCFLKYFFGDPFMHWRNFDLELVQGSPTNVNDHVMNSKDYAEKEIAKYWLLRFSFEQVPTFFIRFISKLFFQLTFVAVNGPCLFDVSKIHAFSGVVLIGQE